ncbi:MAG: secretin N-terminal domain-containing protein [Pyrinomonadaceae bacterium]
MKKSAYVRFSVTLLLLFSLLSPTAVLASGDGKKHFKKGMKHESAEEWDQAVEEFALAIVDNPRNPEYRLHYQRALFNASQMYMKKGTAQANEKDYAGAYISFRKAYGYDPVNELAKAEMDRMIRLQKGLENPENPDEKGKSEDVKFVSTTYNGIRIPDDVVLPQKIEQLRDVPFPNDVSLTWLIKELAKDLDLNVLFDSGSRLENRKIKIELKNVTAAKALDYIFLQEFLFFQKVGPRTILVADGNRRQNYQQLVLRTFYLANASPKDVANVVKTAIPAQPGRTPTIVLTDDATNSITIRDTSENIRLIGRLIKSLDKDRAEVVMDVQIFEVSKEDLLQLGNQIGNQSSLTNLGAVSNGIVSTGSRVAVTNPLSVAPPTALGAAILIPATALSAFQSKNNTKLIASTQIHAFNNEDSSARIGQRVPVRTASFAPVGTTGGTNTGNNFVGDVINYEQTGLTLKFKPIVFPNQDVQVNMEIESKDVSGVTSGDLNPTFTERTIKGTARVQNNKTLLLASVAQGVESNGRAGLPILGLIPILGRLFTAPTKNNRQIDVVIAVTPRVIRAPAILPEDLEERETGSLAVPTSGSLEAMIIQEEIEEQLAAARRLGNTAKVQLPDQQIDQPTYVPSSGDETSANGQPKAPDSGASAAVATDGNPVLPGTENGLVKSETGLADPNRLVPVREDVSAEGQKEKTPVENQKETKKGLDDSATPNNLPSNIQPIKTEVKTLQIEPTSDQGEKTVPVDSKDPALEESGNSNLVEEIKLKPLAFTAEMPNARLQLLCGKMEMKTGEKKKIPLILSTTLPFQTAVLGFRFDPVKTAVREVYFGDIFGPEIAYQKAIPFQNENGKTYVTLASNKEIRGNNSGVLAYIEIEALADGPQEITFEKEMLNFLTADGKNLTVQF